MVTYADRTGLMFPTLPHPGWPPPGQSVPGPSLSSIKPCTDLASNLLAIELRLDVQIACDGLQQKFQHAEYFTCVPSYLSQFSSNFQTVFSINLGFS